MTNKDLIPKIKAVKFDKISEILSEAKSMNCSYLIIEESPEKVYVYKTTISRSNLLFFVSKDRAKKFIQMEHNTSILNSVIRYIDD